MRENESQEDYVKRMDALADNVFRLMDGVDVNEAIMVLTRLTIDALDQVKDPKHRRGIIYIIKQYYKNADIHLGDVH